MWSSFKKVLLIPSSLNIQDGQFWTLNNRRLAVFSELERKGRCKVVRVRVRHPSQAVTEWLQHNTTTNSGQFIKVRVTADEAEKCPSQELELFEHLLTGEEAENNRKPENWSREKYERERAEREEEERAARNPMISVPDGWGEKRGALPVVQASSSSSTPAGQEVMFDPNDLDFDLDDLLLEAEDGAGNGNNNSATDSGRGSSSNVSEVCSQNGGRTYTGSLCFCGFLFGGEIQVLIVFLFNL